MTHYNIDYKGLPFLEAHKKALADCKEYCGSEVYWQKVITVLKSDDMTPLGARFALSCFVGIEGFPATCLIREYLPISDEIGDYGWPD